MTTLAVFAPRRLARLFVSDALNIGRDPTLLFATALGAIAPVALWFWRTELDAAAFDAFGIAEISRYAVAIALVLPAFLIGWVTGFLILEDRDDGPLLALDVSPIGKSGFALYRAGVTVLVCTLVTLVGAILLLTERDLALQLLISLLVSANAVAVAFALPAIARNKVEGLALTKVANIGSIVPLLAALPSPWRYLGGFVPTFWIGELLGLSSGAHLPMPLVVAAALVVHGALVAGLFFVLGRRIG